jgi:hypothetical protein
MLVNSGPPLLFLTPARLIYGLEITETPFLKGDRVFSLLTYPLLDLSLSISYNATKKKNFP